MTNHFAEIDRILQNVRSSYDAIMDYLPKALYLKRSFEDRYLECLKSKGDPLFLLKGEQEFLEPLLVEAQVVKDRQDAYKERNKGGFAEGILGEIQAAIINYPILEALDSNCTKEVARLYGAIHEFLNDYWGSIAYYLRGTSAELGVEIGHLERTMADIYSVVKDRLPKALESYDEMVRNHSANSSERVRAAQYSIRLAGIWLNNLRRVFELSIATTTGEVPSDISLAASKLSAIIDAFRLEAFAKRKDY